MILQKKTLSVQGIMGFLREHKDILIQYQVKRIGLFGSYLHGRQSRLSDVDFLVEFVKPSFDNYMGLLEFLEQGLGREVDLVTRKSLSRYILPQVRKEVRWYETR
jgi:predicted nucleotidyltransferase